MPFEALDSKTEPVDIQAMIDMCTLRGWAGVYIPYTAGSVFPEGHFQVFYRCGDGGHTRMLYADERGRHEFMEMLSAIPPA